MITATSPRRHVTIIVPCYNEQEAIESFFWALKATTDRMEGIAWRYLFVDDGSTDATREILNNLAVENPEIDVCSFSRNFGHQTAISAGLDFATGDAVIIMDADLQHPPAVIPQMIELWQQGYEIVSAVRSRTEGVSVFKRLSSSAFYWFINRLSDVPIIANAADFCLLSRMACQALRAMPERHRFLRGMISWIGFSRATVSFVAPARVGGVSKYNFAKSLHLAIDAALSFSTIPLTLAIRLGALTALSGLIYLVYCVGRYFAVGDTVPGWASLLCTLLVLSGMQLICMGLIGAYLGRVFEQVKGRPLYVVQQPCRMLSHYDEVALQECVEGTTNATYPR